MTITQQPAGQHAFTAALAARDIEALEASLARGVVLHSAITSVPFEGREVVADVYRSLFESFEELTVTDRFDSRDSHAFFWEGRIDGRYVAGADLIRFGADGKVREITIVGRPLSGLATFLTGIGYHFARRRRGPAVARALRITARPLPAFFTLFDPMTRWLQRGRTGAGSSQSSRPARASLARR